MSIATGAAWEGPQGPCSEALGRNDTLQSAGSIDSTPWSERYGTSSMAHPLQTPRMHSAHRDSMLLRRQSWLASRPSAPLARLLSDASSGRDGSQSDMEHTLTSTLDGRVVVEEATDESHEHTRSNQCRTATEAGELVPYVTQRGPEVETSGSGQDSVEGGLRFDRRRPVPYVLYISMVGVVVHKLYESTRINTAGVRGRHRARRVAPGAQRTGRHGGRGCGAVHLARRRGGTRPCARARAHASVRWQANSTVAPLMMVSSPVSFCVRCHHDLLVFCSAASCCYAYHCAHLSPSTPQ